MSEPSAYISPTALAFFIIVIGYYVGKIKIRALSLDLAAVLICAVAAGGLISISPLGIDTAYISSLNAFMKCLSSLGTALFVAAVGLSSGYSLSRSVCPRSTIHFLFGGFVVLSGFGIMRLIEQMDTNITHSALLGILCGSLTSTPGMSAACERYGIAVGDIALGYGSAYLFGVIFVVLFVQILTRRKHQQTDEKEIQQMSETSKPMGAFIQIGMTIVLGTLIGNLYIFRQGISLGLSGGILLAGILTGYIIQKRFPNTIPGSATISLYRNTGLVFFFAGSGVPAGLHLQESFQFKWLIYGMVITVIPLVAGYLFSKILKRTNKQSACLLAGGMTSTPAAGVLAEKTAIEFSSYSAAYLGALVTMVVGIRWI